MADVIIGIDPHKGSHTAVAVDATEAVLGELRVRASAKQVDRLRTWARCWPERSWAVEGSHGLGHLLAQQLLADSERVVDVQPKLAARVLLLNTGKRAADRTHPRPEPRSCPALTDCRPRPGRSEAETNHRACRKPPPPTAGPNRRPGGDPDANAPERAAHTNDRGPVPYLITTGLRPLRGLAFTVALPYRSTHRMFA